MKNTISDKTKLEDIVFSNKFYALCYRAEFYVALYLAKTLKSDIYIYGFEKDTPSLVKLFITEGVTVKSIISHDVSIHKQEQNIHDTLFVEQGVDIITLDMLPKNLNPNSICFVFIEEEHLMRGERLSFSARIINKFMHKIKSVLYLTVPTMRLCNFLANYSYQRWKVTKQLNAHGINNVYWINSEDQKYFFQLRYFNWEAGRQQYYQKNIEKLVKVSNLFNDSQSIATLEEYVRSYCENDIYRLEQILFRYKYFYGSNTREILYEHFDGEVWVNCGALLGETVMAYLAEGLPFKSIYAIDENRIGINSMNLTMRLLPHAIQTKIHIIKHHIGNSSDLGKILNNEKVTLINADIEGAELPLLKGIKDIIVQDRPVLSICVYHRKEDLIEIPLFLSSILDNYVFYLRKYVPNSNQIRQNHELVFFAIPNERKALGCQGRSL